MGLGRLPRRTIEDKCDRRRSRGVDGLGSRDAFVNSHAGNANVVIRVAVGLTNCQMVGQPMKTGLALGRSWPLKNTLVCSAGYDNSFSSIYGLILTLCHTSMNDDQATDYTPRNLVYPSDILPNFFATSPCTQEECNDKVLEYCGAQHLNDIRLDWDPECQGCFSYTVIIDAKNSENHLVKLVAQFRSPGQELFVPQISILNSGLPMQVAITPYAGISVGNQGLNFSEQHHRNAAEDLAEFLTAPYFRPRTPKGEVDRLVTRLREWSQWKINPRIDAVVKEIVRRSGMPKPLHCCAHHQWTSSRKCQSFSHILT